MTVRRERYEGLSAAYDAARREAEEAKAQFVPDQRGGYLFVNGKKWYPEDILLTQQVDRLREAAQVHCDALRAIPYDEFAAEERCAEVEEILAALAATEGKEQG